MRFGCQEAVIRPLAAVSGRLYKLFGVVTNRAVAGDQVIWWLRERCGKSEEVHSAMKSDLAGGQMPSGLFGANAAYYGVYDIGANDDYVILALESTMIPGNSPSTAFGSGSIGSAGRVISG
jgi:hypothetical protein